MTSPSMVQRAGDTLVIRSLVSGDQLFVNDSGTELYPEDIDYNDDDMSGDVDKTLPQCKIRRNYSCSNCNYFTQNPRHFLYHLRDVHQEKVKIYECPNCLYASKHFQKLLRHTKMVHGNCDNLEFSESSKNKLHKKKKRSEAVHYRKADNESKVEYEPPDKRNKQDLKQFDDSMGKLSSELKCSLCSFTTRHQGQLTRHEKQEHIKTKFFRCTKCSYVTHIKARFTKHVKYHSMPMIKCDLCDFRTPYKWNLDRHYKNHNGHGSFKCSACNFTADIKQSLTVHEMNHHVPPVGQAAGLGVGRRRNKVGASDTTAAEDEEHENELRQERERNRTNEGALHEEFPQTSTPKQNEDYKNNSKLKISIKKSKNIPQTNDKHNFYMDFIHSNDIIHHANGNIYIKKKCKYCSFKTAWESEMTRHERKIHNIREDPVLTIPKKIPRPIPNLIPIQYSPPNHDSALASSNVSETGDKNSSVVNLSDIKELSAKAGFSSLHDFISLFGDDESEAKKSNTDNLENSKTDSSILNTFADNNSSVMQSTPDVNNLKRKHTSFFDKLKAKLMTNAGEIGNLTCKWCGHESKCLSELAGHQKICGKEPNNSSLQPKAFNASSTRCQFCRQRCKSSIDLFNHIQVCPSTNRKDTTVLEETKEATSSEDTKDTKSETSETHKDEIVVDDVQEPHPMENVVFVWNNINQNETENIHEEKNIEEIQPEFTIRVPTPESEISVDSVPVNHTNTKMPTHGTDLDQVCEGKKVFKCPHCTFWASTASRFHVHIVGHLNKKPFECSLCSYRSNWRWDITKHIRLKSVRDIAHSKAKVLMTDETGRRNYSKYNKYLTQMKSNKSQGERKEKSETQGQVTPDQILTPLPQLVQAASVSESKPESSVGQLRPPPPLKPAYITYYHNVQEQGKKKNDPDMKKTLFKCKKCNFRDANRENILIHVKGHYRQEGGNESNHEVQTETILDDEVSVSSSDAPFRCGHCHQVSNWKHVIQRHCRLKHSGDVRVLIGGKNGTPEKVETDEQLNDSGYFSTKEEEMFKCIHCSYMAKNVEEIECHINTHLTKQENELKCCFCSYIAKQKYVLYDHLKLHGVLDPEDFFNKSLPDASLAENSLIYVRKFKCQACPYIDENRQQFLSHKQFHRPRGAPYKCKYCSYNVSKTHLLQQHLRVHAANDDIQIKTEDIQQPQLDTHTFKDVPLVWVSKDNKFTKMYKCRFCPHINARKVNIQEHEKMHGEHEESTQSTKDEVSYSCPDCSYVCNNAGVLSAHFKTHQGVHGQIHCLVDLNKSDDEQLTELTNLLQKNYQTSDYISVEDNIEHMEIDENDCDTEKLNATIEITQEPERILYFCQHCPARYLYEKELETHIRFHRSRLFYKCEYCTYTARQRPHLLAHYGVHSQEYNLETKLLQNDYSVSKDNPPPNIGIVEGANLNNEPVCAVIVEGMSMTQFTIKPEIPVKVTNKKYSCPKCPTKFYNGELLSYHMTLHGGKHPYKCHMCDYSAITRNNLEKHERIHGKIEKKEPSIQISIGNVPILPGTRLYQQILDAKKHNEKFVLKSDQVMNELNAQGKNKGYPQLQFKTKGTKDKRYRCSKCPCTFEKKEQYKIHLSLHGSKQRYQCDKCDYSVKYYANYIQHIRKHDSAEIKVPLEDSNDIKEIIIDDDVIDVTEECISPKIAAKTLQTTKPGALKLSLADRQTLMILQEIRNNNVPKEVITEEKKLYWCSHCPYTSYRKDAVDNHINRHICVSGIRNNYTCEHCDYTVPQSHFLREHTKIHFSAFKYHQPEAYMVGNNVKLSFEKCDEDKNQEQDENILFEDCGNVKGKEQFQPKFDDSLLTNNNDVKIFINPNTQEVVENSLQDNTETKEEGKS